MYDGRFDPRQQQGFDSPPLRQGFSDWFVDVPSVLSRDKAVGT
jgi:hypothetical protein